MHTLTLRRARSTDQGTPGALYRADGTRVCYTLELPWRDNLPRRSSIPPGTLPAGRYRCVMVWSPKFGRVYTITGVPGRSAILIHSGNFAGNIDKGLKSHVLGCVLVGKFLGNLNGQLAIINSMPARTAFQNEMKGESFTLEVVPWTSVQS